MEAMALHPLRQRDDDDDEADFNHISINIDDIDENQVKDVRMRIRSHWFFIPAVLLVLVIFIVTVAVHSRPNNQTTSSDTSPEPGKSFVSQHRNVILMISDGFGPASQTFARTYFQSQLNASADFELALDNLTSGIVRTQSSSSFVTDSAAAATAYACGQKTYNGAIGVTANGDPCPTVLEAAHHQNYLTGLIATSRFSHATPAAFSAHVKRRHQEDEIVNQQLFGINDRMGRTIDLIFAGGACSLGLDNSCRNDNQSLVDDILKQGWKLVKARSEFDSVNSSSNDVLPLLSLFSPDHMNYEIDRDPNVQPSLAEMTLKALQIFDAKLTQNTSGFFLMIEGSRIDMAAHANDPVAHLHEVGAYNDVVSLVRHYVDTHPGTILISVADHETGGVSVGAQVGSEPVYEWRPHVYSQVRKSTERAVLELTNSVQAVESKDAKLRAIKKYLEDVFKLRAVPWYEDLTKSNLTGALIDFPVDVDLPRPTSSDLPAYFFTRRDIQLLLELVPTETTTKDDDTAHFNPLTESTAYLPLAYAIGDLLSRAAEVGWTTTGHTGGDVLFYYYDGHNVPPQSHVTLLEPTTFRNASIARQVSDLTLWPFSNLIRPANKIAKRISGRGSLDNTHVSELISDYLGLNLTHISPLLSLDSK